MRLNGQYDGSQSQKHSYCDVGDSGSFCFHRSSLSEMYRTEFERANSEQSGNWLDRAGYLAEGEEAKRREVSYHFLAAQGNSADSATASCPVSASPTPRGTKSMATNARTV